MILPQSFYARPAREVAQALLGKTLVRVLADVSLTGVIVETEAYCDSKELDLACHGARNKGQPTRRSAIMFGPPGHAYVYFTYGMHWMMNVVTGRDGQPNAVLLRALEPSGGLDLMSQRRPGRKLGEWTNGPAKLTQALSIDRLLNGLALYPPGGSIWIEDGAALSLQEIRRGPRVGLGKTPEPWFSKPWRFWVADNKYVSRR